MKSLSSKTGLPPGSLVHIGGKKSNKVKLTLLEYHENSGVEIELKKIEEARPYLESEKKVWLNIDGLHDVTSLSTLSEMVGLHPLMMEDILNTQHRPKSERFDEKVFITLKMLGINPEKTEMISEQISIVLGKNWVISFQEKEGDIFHVLRERIKDGTSLAYQHDLDYLFYRLVDITVDYYFYVTDFFSEAIEKLEDKVLNDPSDEIIKEILEERKLLLAFRKNVIPLREAIAEIQMDPSPLISKKIMRYYSDIHEHIIQINEFIDSQREMLGNILDLYQTGISNKMNQVMKVLTIISTIFIPLTFIAGIYGMNFESMPELSFRYGYPLVLVLMVFIFFLMLYFFKKKKWL